MKFVLQLCRVMFPKIMFCKNHEISLLALACTVFLFCFACLTNWAAMKALRAPL